MEGPPRKPALPDPLILLGAALAGFVQGLSGFAMGLVATVFWTGVLVPAVATPLVVIASVAGQLMSLRTVLPSLEWRRAAPMVGGGLLGILPGVALLPFIEPHEFRLGVGVLLCLFCPAMLLAARLPRLTWGGGGADAAAGFLGGAMGGIAGLAGPAPILWCALRGWDRDTQRATFQGFLLVIQAAGLVAYLASGLITFEVLHLAAWILPCVLLPSWLGTRLYTRLNGAAFRRVVLGVLALTGLALVIQSRFG